jgi:hypothetical protein
MEQLPAEFQKHFVDLFLTSLTTRRQLRVVLEDSPRITVWLIQTSSNCLFQLVSQRERRLISFFLHNHLEQLHGMRDANGRDLLLHACMCRGRVERTIEMLVRSGFSLQTIDSNGDNAMTLARKYADTKTQNMVAFLVDAESNSNPSVIWDKYFLYSQPLLSKGSLAYLPHRVSVRCRG